MPSVEFVADTAHLLGHMSHERRVDQRAFGAQGDAHNCGHRLQTVVVVVLEGEDIRVARGAEKRLLESTGLIDYLIEHVVGGHTGLAFNHKEGVGFDKHDIQLIVVLGAGPCDAHTYGYLLGRH